MTSYQRALLAPASSYQRALLAPASSKTARAVEIARKVGMAAVWVCAFACAGMMLVFTAALLWAVFRQGGT